MVQPGGQLRLAAEAFDHGRLRRELRVQDLECHLTLEVEIAHPIDPPVAAGTQLAEQLVVVSQRAAQPLLPVTAIVALDCRGAEVPAWATGISKVPASEAKSSSISRRREIALVRVRAAGPGPESARWCVGLLALSAEGGFTSAGSNDGSKSGDAHSKELLLRCRYHSPDRPIAPERTSGAMNA